MFADTHEPLPRQRWEGGCDVQGKLNRVVRRVSSESDATRPGISQNHVVSEVSSPDETALSRGAPGAKSKGKWNVDCS